MPYPKAVASFLKEKGWEVIDYLEVTRTPLSSEIDTLLNLITLGKFTEAKHKANYDKLFHLAVTIRTIEGHAYQLEKNETIRIGKVHTSPHTERIHILPPKGTIDIGYFIDRTRRKMGDHDFFTYSAFNHNCQDFILNLLKASNLLTEKSEHFIKQNAAEILKHLPSYTERLANIFTDLAAIFSGYIPEHKREPINPNHTTLQPRHKVLMIFLDKEYFTKEEADLWIAKNHFVTRYMTDTPKYYRYRQIHQDIEKTHYKPHKIAIQHGYMFVAYP